MLKIFISTFILFFVAELGDKSQITSFTFASRGVNWPNVVIGATLALMLSTGMAILLGSKVSKFIPKAVVKKVSGILFIVMGVFFLISHFVGA